ncbi:hypothetical protein CKO51_13565 [Rhodopirellula sp. SM50]|nr:hypothetical protein [Rhodopirellula sp. SM50]PAY18979.1 hypothetical protein CKO51_13565 [Rhodopirellula sp. SM50]
MNCVLLILVFLAALQLQSDPKETEGASTNVNMSQLTDHWRNHSPGRWENLVFHENGRFNWEVKYRMGREAVSGTYKRRGQDRVELRVTNMKPLESKQPRTAFDPDDRHVYRYTFDEAGNMRVEKVGASIQRPYRIATFATRAYVSSGNLTSNVAEMLKLLNQEPEDAGDGARIINDK